MIIEHELLDQIADDPFEWSLADALEFVAEYKEPWQVMWALYRDGCLTLHNAEGDLLPTWKAEETFRDRDAAFGVNVFLKITEIGSKRVF